jgi:hypothetical protein
MHAKLSMDSELAFLAVDFIDSETRPEILHRRQIHEFGLVLMMSLLRLVAGRRVCPVWVGFRHNRTEDLDGFERFFGCPVNFGRPKTSIVLKRDPSKPVDERLLSILKGHCQEALGRRGEAVSLEDELAYLVASHLHAGAPASHLVARELGLSERTMARRLAGQGTSFGRIVDRVRSRSRMRARPRSPTCSATPSPAPSTTPSGAGPGCRRRSTWQSTEALRSGQWPSTEIDR